MANGMLQTSSARNQQYTYGLANLGRNNKLLAATDVNSKRHLEEVGLSITMGICTPQGNCTAQLRLLVLRQLAVQCLLHPAEGAMMSHT